MPFGLLGMTKLLINEFATHEFNRSWRHFKKIPPVKRKMHYPFKWIQLIEWSNYWRTAAYTYQINWKNAANLCEYASETLASWVYF